VLACPITGLPAPYRDPRTGVPFANVRAYDVLTDILQHKYFWSATLGQYLTPFEVPDGDSGDAAEGRLEGTAGKSGRGPRRGLEAES